MRSPVNPRWALLLLLLLVVGGAGTCGIIAKAGGPCGMAPLAQPGCTYVCMCVHGKCSNVLVCK